MEAFEDYFGIILDGLNPAGGGGDINFINYFIFGKWFEVYEKMGFGEIWLGGRTPTKLYFAGLKKSAS